MSQNDDKHNDFLVNMFAGSMAGIVEMVIMYPIDTVKTRMQSLSSLRSNRSIGETLRQMVVQEGITRPVRGVSASVIGSGPAHAVYFSSYEYIKYLLKDHQNINNHVVYGVAAIVATVAHDGVMTPADVVKQRLQMYNSPYKGLVDCVVTVYRTEGIKAFYRSFTTQLVTNVPFQSIHFVTYELCQSLWNPEGTYKPVVNLTGGAIAGGIAAAVTTPLDVCKTVLNTQEGVKVVGLVNAVKTVYGIGGLLGFFRGVVPRVVHQMPSNAICWSTYEFFKHLLASEKNA